MNAGFAPGPWSIEDRGTRDSSYRVRCEIGKANGGSGMVVVEKVVLKDDARLIAAAPDLYAALASLLTAVEVVQAIPGTKGADIRGKAHAALARARGEAQ